MDLLWRSECVDRGVGKQTQTVNNHNNGGKQLAARTSASALQRGGQRFSSVAVRVRGSTPDSQCFTWGVVGSNRVVRRDSTAGGYMQGGQGASTHGPNPAISKSKPTRPRRGRIDLNRPIPSRPIAVERTKGPLLIARSPCPSPLPHCIITTERDAPASTLDCTFPAECRVYAHAHSTFASAPRLRTNRPIAHEHASTPPALSTSSHPPTPPALPPPPLHGVPSPRRCCLLRRNHGTRVE